MVYLENNVRKYLECLRIQDGFFFLQKLKKKLEEIRRNIQKIYFIDKLIDKMYI